MGVRVRRLVRRRLAGPCPVSRFRPVLRLRAEADPLPGCADPLGCHHLAPCSQKRDRGVIELLTRACTSTVHITTIHHNDNFVFQREAGAMRAGVRCVLAVIGISASVVAGPAGASLAAANQPDGFAVASVLPTRGDVVGVAHPVVVKFRAPVANRHAAERAIEVESAPAMSGKFEWLDNDVVQWVPDRFWPAHSTVALSVGGLSTNFATGPAVVGVASISDHTFTVSIDGVDAGPPSALPAPHHRPHWGQEGVFPASMGRPEYPRRSASTPFWPRNIRWSWIRAPSASPRRSRRLPTHGG